MKISQEFNEKQRPSFVALFLICFLITGSDVLGALLFSVGIEARSYVQVALFGCWLVICRDVFQENRRYLAVAASLLVASFFMEVSFKEPGQLKHLTYLIVLTLVIAMQGRSFRLPFRGLVAFVLVVLGSGAMIDFAINGGYVPAYFVDYYANRGFQVDESSLLPGIGNRRFLADFMSIRAPGLSLDPLANGVIIVVGVYALLGVGRTALMKILVIALASIVSFVLSESRSALLFSLLFLLLRYSLEWRPTWALVKGFVFIFIVVVGWLTASGFESADDSHTRGLLLTALTLQDFFGVGPLWLSPLYVESGVMYLLSGVGVFTFPLLYLWCHTLQRYFNDQPDRCAVVVALLIMLPVHYYVLNVKILAFSFFALSFRASGDCQR